MTAVSWPKERSLWAVLGSDGRICRVVPDEGGARNIEVDRRRKHGKQPVLRYDLADPERDKREAAALDRILVGAPIFEADREAITSLRDRLKGGAK